MKLAGSQLVVDELLDHPKSNAASTRYYYSRNFLTAIMNDSTFESFGFSWRKLAAKWINMADPNRSVPTLPSTAHALIHPPYMAPVTEGKNASLPAKKRPGISVNGVVVQDRLIGENISGVHCVP